MRIFHEHIPRQYRRYLATEVKFLEIHNIFQTVASGHIALSVCQLSYVEETLKGRIDLLEVANNTTLNFDVAILPFCKELTS